MTRKEIAAARHKRWRTANKDRLQEYRERYDAKFPGRRNKLQRARYVENKDKTRVKDREYRSIPVNRMRALISNARVRARNKHMAFEVSAFSVITQRPPTDCACCGKHLDYKLGGGAGHKNAPDAPSIDRLDNSQGYVPGNVFVVCFRCNWVKNDSSPEEIATVLEYMTINQIQRTAA